MDYSGQGDCFLVSPNLPVPEPATMSLVALGGWPCWLVAAVGEPTLPPGPRGTPLVCGNVGPVRCRERLGGLLTSYFRKAA